MHRAYVGFNVILSNRIAIYNAGDENWGHVFVCLKPGQEMQTNLIPHAGIETGGLTKPTAVKSPNPKNYGPCCCKHNFGERGSPRTFASPFSPANILKSSQIYEAGIWNRLIQILKFGEEGGGVLRACGAPKDARRHTQDRKKLVRSAPVAFRKALNPLVFYGKIELCTNLVKKKVFGKPFLFQDLHIIRFYHKKPTDFKLL